MSLWQAWASYGPRGACDFTPEVRQMSGLRMAVAAVVAFGLAAGVRADDKKKAETNKEKLVGVWEATKADEGTLPEGSTVDARDFAKHSSLIHIRKDFIPEIIKSAEDL